jgi:hypothetical protein
MCAMGHGTWVPLPEPLGETPAHDGAWAGDNRKRWVKGTARMVSLSMPNAADCPCSSNASGAGAMRTGLGASSLLFYSMQLSIGSEDETIGAEIVGDRATPAYLTGDYVRHTRRPSCCIACSESHAIQFLLREQNRVLRAAFSAERAAVVRQYESPVETMVGGA